MAELPEVGRFGTLRLLKRHEPDTTVAVYPIDEETVTFGRSKQCSVRLYYNCVSELHCTVQFSEERKAFLLVQGTNGLLVDGCQVNPSTTPGSGPTTVPLTNGSEIEIYKKRFKFEYPPKEIRAALLETPRHIKTSRRSLRMSLIRSAQVFTPRADNNALPRASRRGSIRDNAEWEALRSPVKVPSNNNTIQEMMLLEGPGDDAVVVEEERDLIILEPVANQSSHEYTESATHTPGRAVSYSLPKATPTPPPKPIPVPQSAVGHMQQNKVLQTQTPLGNRRRSAPSLHRAVVLRSAQRAQLERERYEDQQEEDEVEAAVSPERDLGQHEVHLDEDEDGEQELLSPSMPGKADREHIGIFRANIVSVKKPLSFPHGWKEPDEDPLSSDEADEGNHGGHQDEDDDACNSDPEGILVQTQTPIRRNMGPFMTPQIWVNRRAERVPVPVDIKATRASIGGEGVRQPSGGAQRVRIVPPWKIQDIVLPESEKKPHVEKGENRKPITEEERQAILARRKSALQESTAPLPMPGPRPRVFSSQPLHPSHPLRGDDSYTPGEDEHEDEETMLERMKMKVDGVRRKSVVRKMRMTMGVSGPGNGIGASPSKTKEFSLLADGVVSRKKFAAHYDDGLGRDDDGAESDAPGPAAAATNATNTSLTPRFDGVREMFRHQLPPGEPPKTPCFTGMRKMFQGLPPLSKTPCFHGVREMFDDRLLGEDEDEDELGNGYDVGDEPVNVPSPIPKRGRRPRPPEKGVAALGSIPPPAEADVFNNDMMDEDDEEIESDGSNNESKPPPPTATRRATKRVGKATTRAVTNDEESTGRGRGTSRSRSTKKIVGSVAATGEGSSKGTVGRKNGRANGKAVALEEESESEVLPAKSGGRAGSGRGKHVTRRNQQQVGQEGYEDGEVGVETLQKSRVVETSSDGEAAPAPKARRRGRPPKTPQSQGLPEEMAPNITAENVRGVKAEDSHDGHVMEETKSTRSKKRGGTKVRAEMPMTVDEGEDGESEKDVRSSEPEVVPAGASKRKTTKKVGGKTLAAAFKDALVMEDKENAGDSAGEALVGKTPAPSTRGRGRPRKTPASGGSVDAVDAPAKRTRSRK